MDAFLQNSCDYLNGNSVKTRGQPSVFFLNTTTVQIQYNGPLNFSVQHELLELLFALLGVLIPSYVCIPTFF